MRVGVETGATHAGMFQTANTGIGKIICNAFANPNIRYLILGKCPIIAFGHTVST